MVEPCVINTMKLAYQCNSFYKIPQGGCNKPRKWATNPSYAQASNGPKIKIRKTKPRIRFMTGEATRIGWDADLKDSNHTLFCNSVKTQIAALDTVLKSHYNH